MNLKLTGARIKERRNKLDMTQSDLAKKLYIKDKGSVSNWENGNPPKTIQRINQLADALECDPEYLLGCVDHPNVTTSWIAEQMPLGRVTIEALQRLNSECIERRKKYASADVITDDSHLTAFLVDSLVAQIVLEQDNGGINETLLALVHQLVDALEILAEWESIKMTDDGEFVFGHAMSSVEELLKLRRNPPERYRMAKWEKEMCEKKIGELISEAFSESLKLFTYYGMEKEEVEDNGNI